MIAQQTQPPTFGSYVLLRPIAESSSAGVYLAASLAEGSKRRLCVLKRKRALEGPPIPLTPIAHGNVVTTLDSGQVGDERFVAVELVEGRDLLALWNRSAELSMALPAELAVAIVMPILDALSQVHQGGAVHAQICPSKVLLGPDGIVKLAEFQLAQTVRRPHDLLRAGYIAPERIAGERVGPTSDLFAAGVMLWELLVQRPLFSVRPLLDGPADSGASIVQKMRDALRGYDLALTEVNRRAPSGLDAVLARALARAPLDRFQTAEEFRDALAPFSKNEGETRALVAQVLSAAFGSEVGLGHLDHDALLASAAALARSRALDSAPRPPRSRFLVIARGAAIGLTATAGLAAASWFVGTRLPRWRAQPESALAAPVAPPPPVLVPLNDSNATVLRGEATSKPAGATVERAPAAEHAPPSATEAPIHQRAVSVSAEPAASPAPPTPPGLTKRTPGHRARASKPPALAAGVTHETQDLAASGATSPQPTAALGTPRVPSRHHVRTASRDDGPTAVDLVAQGNEAFAKGDLDRSLALAIRAAKLGGGEDAYLLVGDASLKTGKRAQAERAYKAALKLNPASRAAERGLGVLRERGAAQAEGRAGDPPRAVQTDP